MLAVAKGRRPPLVRLCEPLNRCASALTLLPIYLPHCAWRLALSSGPVQRHVCVCLQRKTPSLLWHLLIVPRSQCLSCDPANSPLMVKHRTLQLGLTRLVKRAAVQHHFACIWMLLSCLQSRCSYICVPPPAYAGNGQFDLVEHAQHALTLQFVRLSLRRCIFARRRELTFGFGSDLTWVPTHLPATALARTFRRDL